MAASDGRHLMDLCAWELVDMIRGGTVTPSEAVAASLDRIRERDPQLNSFCYVDWTGAMRRADALTARLQRDATARDLPLCGVPIGVKDLEDVEGMPTTYGAELWARRGELATRSSPQVERLISAGCIVVGKTSTSCMGRIAVTKTIPFGCAANPWDTTRSPGGSSGGAGSAVAGRLVPISTSSDGGGSIRIPAALCGVFGLKPSRGRIPTPAGWGMEPWILTSVVGPTTRCVQDAALYMDAVSGPHRAVPCSLPPPPESYVRTLNRPCGNLRLAASDDLGCIEKVRSSVQVHWENALKRAARDHTVHRLSSSELTLPDFGDDWTKNVQAQNYAALALDGGEPELVRGDGRDLVDRGFVRGWDRLEGQWGLRDIARLQRKVAGCNAALARVFENHDLLLTPALPDHAWPIGGPLPLNIEGSKLSSQNQSALYLMPFNYSGHPAAVVCIGHTEAGLPCAMQVVADRHREDLILRFCADWERRYRPFDNMPGFPFRGPPAPRGPRSPKL
eukprot:TRINITY_DN5599_c0_g1_i1.p1 TRINITY_DN5599_c0_g1~~TRINITY_DN5599_c0_g1_i1.p1  ORF type:complete len:526 (+),score=95.81 TRINITY_DN5599_c0_g1_i1:60-1580(+)